MATSREGGGKWGREKGRRDGGEPEKAKWANTKKNGFIHVQGVLDSELVRVDADYVVDNDAGSGRGHTHAGHGRYAHACRLMRVFMRALVLRVFVFFLGCANTSGCVVVSFSCATIRRFSRVRVSYHRLMGRK